MISSQIVAQREPHPEPAPVVDEEPSELDTEEMICVRIQRWHSRPVCLCFFILLFYFFLFSIALIILLKLLFSFILIL